MLIIDKKRLRLKDSGLPQQVIEQTPKLMRRSKLPIVKAKVGARVTTLIADEAVFDDIPLKKEVKATVSGLYITGIRGLRGPLEKPAKKKGFRAKMRDKYNSLSNELKKEEQNSSGSKNSKKNASSAGSNNSQKTNGSANTGSGKSRPANSGSGNSKKHKSSNSGSKKSRKRK
jgi:hypothetical protein